MTNLEKGIITITGDGTKTLRTLNLFDASGKKMAARKTNRTYVAAAIFTFDIEVFERVKGGEIGTGKFRSVSETFYFGRKDLIGKGDSSRFFEALETGKYRLRGTPRGQKDEFIDRTFTRAILFELTT